MESSDYSSGNDWSWDGVSSSSFTSHCKESCESWVLPFVIIFVFVFFAVADLVVAASAVTKNVKK